MEDRKRSKFVKVLKLNYVDGYEIGKIYEVKSWCDDDTVAVYTEDRSDYWYFNLDKVEEVDEPNKSDNRKFKFNGDASEYNWEFKLEEGKVYDGDTIAFTDRTIGSLYDSSKDGEGLADWEIVVDDENTFKPVPPIDPYLKWLGESISLLDSFGADSVEFKAARVVYEYYLREVKKS